MLGRRASARPRQTSDLNTEFSVHSGALLQNPCHDWPVQFERTRNGTQKLAQSGIGTWTMRRGRSFRSCQRRGYADRAGSARCGKACAREPGSPSCGDVGGRGRPAQAAGGALGPSLASPPLGRISSSLAPSSLGPSPLASSPLASLVILTADTVGQREPRPTATRLTL